MSSQYVDPWLAGKATLATAKSRARTEEIKAKADAKATAIAARSEADRRQRHDRDTRAAARRARLAEALAWLTGSWHEALWVPVIVAPAILAWKGQAEAGNTIWGGHIGWLLALFTESAAWVVEFYLQAAARRNPDIAMGRGRAAVWLVALAAAAMNYLHGAATGSWWHGAVMAVVSIGGIALHQVAHSLRHRVEHRSGRTAAQVRVQMLRWVLHPVWSLRATSIAAVRGITTDEAFAQLWLDHWGTTAVGRRERRMARAARSRVSAIERAAARSATAWLHSDGRVELRYPQGPVTLHRRTGRLHATKGVSVADEVARLLARSSQTLGSGRVCAVTGRPDLHPRKATDDPAPAHPEIAPPVEPSEPAAAGINRDKHPVRSVGETDLTDADRQLLADVRAAVADGALNPEPSGYAIYRRVMNGRGDKSRATRVARALAPRNGHQVMPR